MPLSVVHNPVLEKIGKTLNSQVIQWAQNLEKGGCNLNLDRPAHTITTDGKFRLDKQGEFLAHDVRWINLQVQYRDITLFTVYVHKDAWTHGFITEHSVLYAVKQGAHRGYVEQTIYYKSSSPHAVMDERAAPVEIPASKMVLRF
jgi:hypothetical protein